MQRLMTIFILVKKRQVVARDLVVVVAVVTNMLLKHEPLINTLLKENRL